MDETGSALLNTVQGNRGGSMDWIEISQNAETGEWSYLRAVNDRIVDWEDGFPTREAVEAYVKAL